VTPGRSVHGETDETLDASPIVPVPAVRRVAGGRRGFNPDRGDGATLDHLRGFAGHASQAQCWALREDIPPPMPSPVGVADGDLHLSTLGFGNNVPPNNGGGVWWERTDVAIDFSTDFAVEARLRIASAPDHSVNTESGWPRPGYALTVYDTHGRLFWVGFGGGEIFLSNTAFGQYGQPQRRSPPPARPSPRLSRGSRSTRPTRPATPDSLFKIIQPGSYYLTGNITGVVGKHGIKIAAGGERRHDRPQWVRAPRRAGLVRRRQRSPAPETSSSRTPARTTPSTG
jgi:hypothetical protein